MSEVNRVSVRLNTVGCDLGEIGELLHTVANSGATLRGDSVHAIVTALRHVREELHDIHDEVEQCEWSRPLPTP